MTAESQDQLRPAHLGEQPRHRFAAMKVGTPLPDAMKVGVRPEAMKVAAGRPSISIRTRRWQTAADIIVQGTGFTPGGEVVLTMFGIPGHDSMPEVGTATADPNGTAHFEAEFGLVWGDTTDAAAALFVVARDEATQTAAFARLPRGAAAWIVIAH